MSTKKKNAFARFVGPKCRELLAMDNPAKQVLQLPHSAKCLMVIGMEDTPELTKIRTLTALGQRTDGTIVLDVHYQHVRCNELCARVELNLEQIEAYAQEAEQEGYRPGRMQTRGIPGITVLRGNNEGQFKFSTAWMSLILQRLADCEPELDVLNAARAGLHLPVFPIRQPHHPYDADELRLLLNDDSRHQFDHLVYQYLNELHQQLA